MFPREESDGDINTLCNDLSEDESKTVDSRKIGEREVYLFFFWKMSIVILLSSVI